MKLKSKQICYILLVLIVGYLLYCKNNGKISKFQLIGVNYGYWYTIYYSNYGPAGTVVKIGFYNNEGGKLRPVRDTVTDISASVNNFNVYMGRYDWSAEYIVISVNRPPKRIVINNKTTSGNNVIWPQDFIFVTYDKKIAGITESQNYEGPWYIIKRQGLEYTLYNNVLERTGWADFKNFRYDNSLALDPSVVVD